MDESACNRDVWKWTVEEARAPYGLSHHWRRTVLVSRCLIIFKLSFTCLFFQLSPICVNYTSVLSRYWSQCLHSVRCGVPPLAFWDFGFEYHQVHRCLSLLSVVCCQVEVCVYGLSLVQKSPVECGVSECDCETSIMRRLWPRRGYCSVKKRKLNG